MKYQNFSLSNEKSLDGIRGFAVLLVVFFHSPLPLFHFDFGWSGVNLFFILSGYLITRILLSTKYSPFKGYAKSFYMRRLLRIFPLYLGYILLTGTLILFSHYEKSQPYLAQGYNDFIRNYPFLFSYTYNFQPIFNLALDRSYESSYFFGHLWSLSVEEQFYFIFPFIIYFVRTNFIRPIFIGIIIIIPLLRWCFVDKSMSQIDDRFFIGTVLYTASPFQLDAILMGSILALTDLKKIMNYWKILCVFLLMVSTAAGIYIFINLSVYNYPIMGGSLGFDAPVYHPIFATPNFILNHRYLYTLPLLNGIFSLLLVLSIHQKKIRFVMEQKWLVTIGKISYGIYIYHLALSYVFGYILERFVEIKSLSFFSSLLMLFVYLMLLFLFAFISYRFYESRFLVLKRNYPYPSN